MITRSMIPMTDDRGRPLLDGEQMAEPLPGSVVLTQGMHGTAWQKFFDGGLWYAAGRGGRGIPWQSLVNQRNLVLVYDAPQRETGRV